MIEPMSFRVREEGVSVCKTKRAFGLFTNIIKANQDK